MIAQATTTQLPDSSTFASEPAILRPVAPPLSPRDEVRLMALAREIVDYSPYLAHLLRENGMRRLRRELVEA